MDQSLVHIFSRGNSYGPMVLKVFLSFPLDWYWSMDGSSQIQEPSAPLVTDVCSQRTPPYYKDYRIVSYYAVVFLLRPPCLLRCEALFEGKMPAEPRKIVSAQGRSP